WPMLPCWARNTCWSDSTNCMPAMSGRSTFPSSLLCRLHASGPQRFEAIQHQAAHLRQLIIARGEQRRFAAQHGPAFAAQHTIQITDVAVDRFEIRILAVEQRLEVA